MTSNTSSNISISNNTRRKAKFNTDTIFYFFYTKKKREAKLYEFYEANINSNSNSSSNNNSVNNSNDNNSADNIIADILICVARLKKRGFIGYDPFSNTVSLTPDGILEMIRRIYKLKRMMSARLLYILCKRKDVLNTCKVNFGLLPLPYDFFSSSLWKSVNELRTAQIISPVKPYKKYKLNVERVQELIDFLKAIDP